MIETKPNIDMNGRERALERSVPLELLEAQQYHTASAQLFDATAVLCLKLNPRTGHSLR